MLQDVTSPLVIAHISIYNSASKFMIAAVYLCVVVFMEEQKCVQLEKILDQECIVSEEEDV